MAEGTSREKADFRCREGAPEARIEKNKARHQGVCFSEVVDSDSLWTYSVRTTPQTVVPRTLERRYGRTINISVNYETTKRKGFRLYDLRRKPR
jgi:hypothetical protein